MKSTEQYRAVPMRLFATWEVDRASPSSVPRICTMSLKRLTVLKPLDSDMNWFVIAVKLLGYKRTLRSNDFNVTPINGIIDIDLDISFTLQYPHFVKRKNNGLHVLLQRRKRYKNRPIPGGFKTLGTVNLTEVLQCSIGRELTLYQEDGKDDSFSQVQLLGSVSSPVQQSPIAKLYFLACQSLPLEPLEVLAIGAGGKSKEIETMGDFSDDEADDDSTNEDGASDSDPINEPRSSNATASRSRHPRIKRFKFGSNSNNRKFARQKNLKQKFVALLKRFKIPEEVNEAYCGSHSGSRAGPPTSKELEALWEELGYMSDSGPELDVDKMSIVSNPRPGLQPYFNSDDTITTTQQQFLGNNSDVSDEGGTTTDLEHSCDPLSSSSPIRTALNSRKLKFENRRSDISRGHVEKTSSSVQKKTKLAMKTSPDLGERAAEQAMLLSHSQTAGSLKEPSIVSKCTANSEQQNSTATNVYLKFPPICDEIAVKLKADEPIGLGQDVWLVSALDVRCGDLVQFWRNTQPKLIVVDSLADVKLVFAAIVARIQKFCNTNSAPPKTTTIVLIGGDKFVSFNLRCYLECLAQKQSEWLHYLRFTIVAPASSVLSRNLASVDTTFSTSVFSDSFWKDWWDKTELNALEQNDITHRIKKYLLSATGTMDMPVGEAMLQFREKRANDDNPRVFVPFLVDVRLGGPTDDEAMTAISGEPSSPRDDSQTIFLATGGPGGSPPQSPNVTHSSHSHVESTELHLEYWVLPTSSNASCQLLNESPCTPSSVGGVVSSSSPMTSSTLPNKKDSAVGVKCSLKSAFKSLAISRRSFDAFLPSLTLSFIKEKRKDKMLHKLGMKNRQKNEPDQNVHNVNAVSRLICSSKHATFRVWIDGVDWINVKYFQTSAQWQTHVKQFPLFVCLGD